MARQLEPGEAVEENGISFTFTEDLNRMIKSTSSESGAFAWRWLALGKVIEVAPSVETARYDGFLLMGEHDGQLHALVLPTKGSRYLYARVNRATVDSEAQTKKGMMGGTKLTGVEIAVTPTLGIAAYRIDEVVPGSQRLRGKRSAEFCQAFGVAVS